MRNPAVKELAKTELTLKNEFTLMKLALKMRVLLWKMTHGG